MELHVIEAGKFKLDGGAMFGVVPKVLWQKTNIPDENNLCTWAMRCLLIEEGNRLVLIDTGMGNKQSENFFKHYYPKGNDKLVKSIENKGFSREDITDVFLTHLHFDHCGGAVERNGDRFYPTFPNARYWSNRDHWQWAINPNAREKASFLKENLLPLQESGQLNFILDQEYKQLHIESILLADGHTEKQMIPYINYKGHTIVYMADLLPSTGHIPLPYVMGYDVRPLITLKEKEIFLKEAVENDYILFLEHDEKNMCCKLKNTEKGPRLDHTFKLSEI